MYLVDRIIERCENSSRDWREGATGGRTLRITQEDYDACGKEELIEEVQRLERAGLLTVKKWVVPDSDVELVAYQVEHLPDFYRLADSESGEEYWPKQAKVNYYIRMIDQELSEGFQKEWIENYLEKLKGRIAEGDLPKNIEKLEKYLQRMNLVSFSKYTQKKSFPSSVRTPFEIQNDFIEFLQVLYEPYCYSREKESIARTLRDYLDAHYTEEISLNDLARQYSYSPSHLIRSFHQAYGASPMQYLKKLRIEHASQLLLHSDATIQSVGEMVGLRIPSYFIRVFKQEIGITPAQYRMFYAEENGGSEAP